MFQTEDTTDFEHMLHNSLDRAKATACLEGRRPEHDKEKEITDPEDAQQHLVGWIKELKVLTEAGQ